MANSSPLWTGSWDQIETWDQIRNFSIDVVRFVYVESSTTWSNVPTTFHRLRVPSPLQNSTKDFIKVFLERYKEKFHLKLKRLLSEEVASLEFFSINCKYLMRAAIVRDIDKEFPASLRDKYNDREIEQFKKEIKRIKLYVHVLHLAKLSEHFYQQGVVDAPEFAMLVIDECLRLYLKTNEKNFASCGYAGEKLIKFFDGFACCTRYKTVQTTNMNLQAANVNVNSADLINVHDADMNIHVFNNMDIVCDMIDIHHDKLLDDQHSNAINRESSNVMDQLLDNVIDQALAKVMDQSFTSTMDKAYANVDKAVTPVINVQSPNLMRAHPSNITYLNSPNVANAYFSDFVHVPPSILDGHRPNVTDVHFLNVMDVHHPKIMDVYCLNTVDVAHAEVMNVHDANMMNLQNEMPQNLDADQNTYTTL